MRSYLLKATDEEMDRWREAAGDEPLARFLRRAANALADGSLRPVMVVAARPDESGPALSVAPVHVPSWQPTFRPDFKSK